MAWRRQGNIKGPKGDDVPEEVLDGKQDRMPSVTMPESTSSQGWVKFASVQLPAAYSYAAGTWVFTPTYNNTVGGIMKWYMRNGASVSQTSMTLTWLAADNSGYGANVAAIKVSDGSFDVYYKSNSEYDRMSVADVCPVGIKPSYVAGTWVSELPSEPFAVSSFNPDHQRANLLAPAIFPPDVAKIMDTIDDQDGLIYKMRKRRASDTDPGDSEFVQRSQFINTGKPFDWKDSRLFSSVTSGHCVSLSTAIWCNTVDAASINWNSLPQGIFEVDLPSDMSASLNQPVGAGRQGALICLSSPSEVEGLSGNVGQVYLDYSQGQIWLRGKVGSGSFSAWKKVGA